MTIGFGKDVVENTYDEEKKKTIFCFSSIIVVVINQSVVIKINKR